MKQYFVTLFLAQSLLCNSSAQDLNKSARDGFMITRMVEKFHVAPKPLDNLFSENVWQQVIASLDNERLFFTVADIARLSEWRQKLDEQVSGKKTEFLTLLASLYQERLIQSDSAIGEIGKQPIDFSVDESFTVKEDSSWPVNLSGIGVKLTKKLKLDILEMLESGYADWPGSKKLPDTIQTTLQRKAQSSYKRHIGRLLQSPGGIHQLVGDTWCRAIASYYDPHTEFFPLSEKENFEGELGKQPFRFGFRTQKSKERGVIISDLEPGSPAFKSGVLNKGDKFETIQWEGKQPLDVSDATPQELGSMMDESNHDKLSISVKKADGTTRTVTLVKERAELDEEEDKVKSFILKGTKTIGYISLPAFYSDWENEDEGVKGCANDVAREILKLKKENISGLVLDLRFNGGGSLREAAELTGIFIDAGPVEQLKLKTGKVYTLKDANRGTIYDGPLLVMVNGYSASAPEMVAGTLQDYNRALILGSATYGKATSQVVFPMDTTVTMENLGDKQTDSYIKITTSQLFRINGTTAQASGITPDIALPDLLQVDPHREIDEKFALQASIIGANNYYKAYNPLLIQPLKAIVKNITDTSRYFKTLNSYLNNNRGLQPGKNISLKWPTSGTEAAIEDPTSGLERYPTTIFTIENNAFELERLKTNSSLKELNNIFRDYLISDPYLEVSYRLITQM